MQAAKAGSRKMERMVLGVVLIGAWCMMSSAAPTPAPAPAPQLDCSSEVTLLVPCLGYVQGSDKNPSSDCCKGLTSVVDTSPVCLCQLINSGAGADSGINSTLALQLPSKCNLTNLDPSQCSGKITHLWSLNYSFVHPFSV
ncbi:hypothetical protein O6H91_Y016700 [Diphasiastrum complanatum]|nr:hypothetical protein O6H91_Y016700 [Diphasiastrum complanatum]